MLFKQINIDAVCDKGCVRENNEDMILVCGDYCRDQSMQLSLMLDDSSRLAVAVADGMGGHNGGEFASELAVQAFDTFITNMPSGLDDDALTMMLREWATDTHSMINSKGELDGEFYHMGSTFVALVVYEGRIFWMNIGDSRLYSIRHGILMQISADHSLRNLYNDPSLPSNAIYSCLGGGTEACTVDIEDLTYVIQTGDKFLLCSDGLSDIVADMDIEQILYDGGGAQTLVRAAKDAGGRDNISVVLVEGL